MNLLAHLHLSHGCDAETLTANVLADYLGRYDPVEKMNQPIADRLMPGILLHREIDRYTDSHAVLAEARNIISEPRRRLAGIIVDIAFDYYLCRHWQQYSDALIEDVISHGYATMAMVASTSLSYETQRLVSKMRSTNWLASYGTIEGQKLTYLRVSKRSPAVAKLVGAEDEILNQDAELEDCFLRFYPQLVDRITDYKADI